ESKGNIFQGKVDTSIPSLSYPSHSHYTTQEDNSKKGQQPLSVTIPMRYRQTLPDKTYLGQNESSTSATARGKKNPLRLLPFIFQHEVQDEMHRSGIVLIPGQPNYPIKGCGSRIIFC